MEFLKHLLIGINFASLPSKEARMITFRFPDCCHRCLLTCASLSQAEIAVELRFLYIKWIYHSSYLIHTSYVKGKLTSNYSTIQRKNTDKTECQNLSYIFFMFLIWTVNSLFYLKGKGLKWSFAFVPQVTSKLLMCSHIKVLI